MDRLNEILVSVRFGNYYPKGNFFRLEFLQAIRKFAVMGGDVELEAACDERINLETQN